MGILANRANVTGFTAGAAMGGIILRVRFAIVELWIDATIVARLAGIRPGELPFALRQGQQTPSYCRGGDAGGLVE